MKELVKRKTPRLQCFDYNRVGAYLLTICTQNRRQLLSCVVGTGVPDCPQIKLTKCGEVADKYIKRLDNFYTHLSVASYVIMPNHIHIMLVLKENGQSRTPVPTSNAKANNAISQFVSTFKRFCNKEFGENVWQSRYHDHVIRDRADYESHLQYIQENPRTWKQDELYQAD